MVGALLLFCDLPREAQASAQTDPLPRHATGLPKIQGPSAGYDDGLFVRSRDGRFSLNVNLWGQLRFTFQSDERADRSRANAGFFKIPHARLAVGGNLFGPPLRYQLDVNFGGDSPVLNFFAVHWRAIPGAAHLSVGQIKRPWSREFIAHQNRLPLAGPSKASAAFYAGKDIGLMLHNGYRRSPTFEYALGVFGGYRIVPRTVDEASPLPTPEPDDVVAVGNAVKPTVAFRFGYNHGGIDGYNFSDLAKHGFRWALAISGLLMVDTRDTTQSLIGTQVDLLAQFRGLSISAAGYVTSHQTGSKFSDRNWERAGFVASIGYVIGSSDWDVKPEIVARYTQIAERAGVDEQEAGGGIHVFFHGKRLRWSTEALWQLSEPRPEVGGPDTTDYQLRTQLAFYL